jgi:hypothetical protein
MVIAGSAALAVAGLAWVLWAVVFHGSPAVTSEDVAFDVVDEHTATMTIRVVRRDADVEASCLIRAQSSDHATVGELNVSVGPGEPTASVVEETVRTERLATSVSLVGCVAEGQKQRR